ncbi:dTDP-glucose 4,6-dehydratase [Thermodesulfovibrio aggregans]|uniref:dTDP-glucose 4,6-dehydratase n=1 Tax=Thermodesulfovibrio aggregans TaxID=86166 RepID=A0A0U9HQ66_9BACT|nr:dTDP-glucose 4,6-dehydratase [Thermodesulfovibrio aggregans]GAQ95131.1 dTDP-glucose 4,6-dehydratase [Thermodesulfovibrio aggregans]
MKLLVTGGAGFIGSEFVRQAVKKGYNVTVLDKLTYAGDLKRVEEVREKIKFYKVDICNRKHVEEIFSTEKPEIVAHFAAETHVDRSILNPQAFLKTNIEGTHNLLELSKKYNISKFINIITDEVYGEIREGKFTESSPLIPNSPYSVSKAAQDMLGRAYFRTYGLPVITVRPSNNYGPWQYPEKLIPVVIIKALNDEPVPVYGDGSNVREWLYVEDCAEAVLEIVEKGAVGEIYNVGSGIERKNIEVVKAILSLLCKPESLIQFIKDRPGHDYRYSVSTEKIESDIGWQPKTSFEDGLERTVSWYVAHLNWVKTKLRQLKRYWNRVYELR